MLLSIEQFLAVFFISMRLLPLCQSVLFKRTSVSVDFLGGVIKFAARSKIECGAQCYLKMWNHSCTAFVLDSVSGICQCGKRSLTPVAITGSNEVLHINMECKKNMKTGWSVLFVKSKRKKICIVKLVQYDSFFAYNLWIYLHSKLILNPLFGWIL